MRTTILMVTIGLVLLSTVPDQAFASHDSINHHSAKDWKNRTSLEEQNQPPEPEETLAEWKDGCMKMARKIEATIAELGATKDIMEPTFSGRLPETKAKLEQLMTQLEELDKKSLVKKHALLLLRFDALIQARLTLAKNFCKELRDGQDQYGRSLDDAYRCSLISRLGRLASELLPQFETAVFESELFIVFFQLLRLDRHHHGTKTALDIAFKKLAQQIVQLAIQIEADVHSGATHFSRNTMPHFESAKKQLIELERCASDKTKIAEARQIGATLIAQCLLDLYENELEDRTMIKHGLSQELKMLDQKPGVRIMTYEDDDALDLLDLFSKKNVEVLNMFKAKFAAKFAALRNLEDKKFVLLKKHFLKIVNGAELALKHELSQLQNELHEALAPSTDSSTKKQPEARINILERTKEAYENAYYALHNLGMYDARMVRKLKEVEAALEKHANTVDEHTMLNCLNPVKAEKDFEETKLFIKKIGH